MFNNVIILMTALIPTTGHADLIRFASSIPNARVHVLVNGRTFEPVSTEVRVKALMEHFKNDENVLIRGSVRDDAPQNPEDMPDGFWQWWADEINGNFQHYLGMGESEPMDWDYVVASEPYGQQVADAIGANFLPYDIARHLNPVKGTTVRTDMINHWNEMIPEMRNHYHFNAVVFGQESVGKTTVSQHVAQKMGNKATWLMEYARPYLETPTIGEELSLQKMEAIHRGQAALQSVTRQNVSTPFAVYDTDLFSTVGYYRIMGVEAPKECIDSAVELSANVYYVLPDDIPLVADPLRYGDGVRESDTRFWIDILAEFNQECVLVPSGSVDDKADFIIADMRARFADRVYDVSSFERD